MTTEYPHVPAAHINAIAEEGTKAEAVHYLQKHWNELCALREQLKLAKKIALEESIRANNYYAELVAYQRRMA